MTPFAFRSKAYRDHFQMESILAERIQQKENELSARYDERLRNHHERYVSPFTHTHTHGCDVLISQPCPARSTCKSN